MDEIYLNLADLESLILELKQEHLDVVALSFLDADPEDDFPAALHVDAVNSSDPSMVVELEELESNASLSHFFSFSGPHTSLT